MGVIEVPTTALGTECLPYTYFPYAPIWPVRILLSMGVATTTDTTDSVRTSFMTPQKLYGMWNVRISLRDKQKEK